MRISDLLSPSVVLPAIRGRTKDEILESLATHLTAHHPEIDHGSLVAALLERERHVSTALVDGVAIPHARVPGLRTVVAVLGRSPAGVTCGSHDGKPTHLFLLFAAPAEAPGPHLRLLAAASRLLHDQRCRAELMEAQDPLTLLGALRDAEDRVHRTAA